MKPARLRPRSPLWRHRDFMKLWIGDTLSQFGTPVSQLAIPLAALLILDASAFEVASLSTVEFLPFLLFALPAGVWVDRVSRRLVLIVGDLGRALILLSIPVAYLLDALTLGQLYAVGFLMGVFTVFFDVAYQSYLPSLVEREYLVEGNSKLEVSRSSAQIAGPALGGGLVGLLTAPYAILADSISYLLSGGFVLSIRKREELPARAPDGSKPRMLPELRAGLSYVLRHRLLLPQAISTGTSNFFTTMSFSITVVYLVRRLDMSPALIGLAFGIGQIGWLLGAVGAAPMQRLLGVGKASIVASLITGPSAVLVPLAPKGFPVPFIVLSGVLGGFGAVVYNIQQVSLRQAITPERMQGRMNAVMRFLVWGTIPLGSLAGGALASAIGLRATLFLGGGAMLAVLPLVLSPIRSLQRIPEPEEPPAPFEAEAAGGLVDPVAAPVTPEA